MKPMRPVILSFSFITCALAIATESPPAAACGGCFHQPPAPTETPSVVTDHRMVLSISQQQTVLWDQIEYSGAPSEFAWVLPVRPGARVELSHDAWLAALDATTNPRIHAPQTACGGGPQGDTAGDEQPSSGGCGGGMNSLSFDPVLGSVEDGGSSSGYQSEDGVSVVTQDVVGPYSAVTIHGSTGEAIDKWLMTNGFDVPASLAPMLAAYTAERMDFIALRLRPGQTTRAMQPVRVIVPGADPTLPLRMVAAGVGPSVSITLFVVGEGRYHTQNFPDVSIDGSKILWDPKTNQSTYEALAQNALSSGDGSGWLTEFSGVMETTTQLPKIGLYDAYFGVCALEPQVPVPCDGSSSPMQMPGMNDGADASANANADASANASADASSDAGDNADGDADANEAGTIKDAGAVDSGCVQYQDACTFYDDLALAQAGIQGPGIWVTRLRANLPPSALARDLVIGATDSQTTMSNVHVAVAYTDPSYDPCPGTTKAAPTSSGGSGSGGCLCTTSRSRLQSGSFAIILLTAWAVSATLRRRRR
jgi:hypothetical protein